MKHNFLANIIAGGCLVILGSTLAPFAPAADLEPIAPLLNEQTYGILALDVERLEVKAVFDKSLAWLSQRSPDLLFTPESLQEATNEIAGMRTIPEKWAQDFRQAGGTVVYALAYASDGPQFILAIPMAKTGNREVMEKLFDPILNQAQLGSIGKQMKGDCLVLGNQDVITHLLSSQPAPRPDLESALASQGQRAVKLALAPTADQKRVIQEMLPMIPVGTNQVPSASIARGLAWAALGIDIVPAASVKLIAQASNAGAGQDLDGLVRSLKRFALALPEEAEMKAKVEKALSRLTPVLDQSRLTLSLDEKALEDLILDLVGPMMDRAKTRAYAIHAMNNAKQIVMGCLMFQTDKNAWPERLQALLEKPAYLPDPQVLRDPRHPRREIGFEYLVPGKDWAKYPATSHILIHEIFETWPAQGLCIGFLDGHAEIMANQSRFDTLLAETKTRNAGK